MISVAGGIAALLLTRIYLGFTATAARSNARQAGELEERLVSLRERLAAARRDFGAAGPGDGRSWAGWFESVRCAAALEAMLATRSVAWQTGENFITAWGELHRGEEALLLATPPADLLSVASRTDLRLYRSDVPNADALSGRLRVAVAAALGKDRLGFLTSPPAGTTVNDAPTDAAGGRAIIADVLYAVNDYRDGIWEGMVYAKQALLARVAVAVFAGYILLLVLILTGATAVGLLIGVGFFLVGGLIGAFSDVIKQRLSTSGVNDYGLGRAQVVANFALSGGAAVGGVAVGAILGTQVISAQLTNPQLASGAATAAATSTRIGSATPNWAEVFGWHNGFSLLAAIAFGYAPSRLFDLFRSEQATAAQQINSSQGTGVSSSANR